MPFKGSKELFLCCNHIGSSRWQNAGLSHFVGGHSHLLRYLSLIPTPFPTFFARGNHPAPSKAHNQELQASIADATSAAHPPIDRQIRAASWRMGRNVLELDLHEVSRVNAQSMALRSDDSPLWSSKTAVNAGRNLRITPPYRKSQSPELVPAGLR